MTEHDHASRHSLNECTPDAVTTADDDKPARASRFQYRQAAACPVCSSGPCASYPSIGLSYCAACKHVFQTDLTVTMRYDAAYVRRGYDGRPVAEMSKLRWDFIQQHLQLPPASRVLDVGYGNGAFLKHAQARGMEIFGLDVHSEDYGIPVVDMDTPLSFDLITFFDSLEHFPSLKVVQQLRSRCVAISIPFTPDYILSTPEAWRHYKPGEHLHYFSPESLTVFMRSWGYSRLVATGHPEDAIRGKLTVNGTTHDNIFTAIYAQT